MSRTHVTRSKPHRWSQRVSQHSDALDLEPQIFAPGSAKRIAQSLKRSALRSHRRKAEPYRLGAVDAHVLYQSCRTPIVAHAAPSTRAS
jgi:hypothetical protein